MSSLDTVIRSVAPLHAGQLRIARLTSEPLILQCVYLAVNLNSNFLLLSKKLLMQELMIYERCQSETGKLFLRYSYDQKRNLGS